MNTFSKIYIVTATLITALTACTDTKQLEKNAMTEVIKVHDEAMAKSEQAVKNKILLDSLTKSKAVADTVKARLVITNLSTADKAMEDWMHQFNADYTGKQHEEIMQYLADQKKKVNEVNNHLATAVTQSNQLIANYKK